MYKSPLCFLPSFKSVGLSIQEKKQQRDFQDGGHSPYLRFFIRTKLAFFIYKLPLCFLRSYKSIGLLVQELNIFSRWPPWRTSSWISDWNYFSNVWSTSHRNFFNYFSNLLSTCHRNASYQVSSQLAFWFRRRNEKYIFKMAATAAIWSSARVKSLNSIVCINKCIKAKDIYSA